jgi:hypothetical protein
VIKLKFLQNFSPYKKGDVASFRNDADAERFLSAKINKKAVAEKAGRSKSMKSAPVDK